MSSEQCPNAEVLSQLCAGVLTDERETQVTAHVGICLACQAKLDQIGGTQALAKQLPAAFGPAAVPSSLRQRLEQLKSERFGDRKKTERNLFTDLLPWLETSDVGIGKLTEFELHECIGRGGMGAVFKAHDIQLQRTVAIKFMSPALLVDDSARTRFLREAQSAAKICHPNVVTIHAVSEVRGLPYLVMEYVEGASLQERLDRSEELSIESVVTIAWQIAEGLAAAHASGVIHRDVKPANILLSAHSSTVKLTDFGLARCAAESSLTQTGLLIGTPEFIAPEQVNSGGTEVDHRADLFSLGSVCYLMCAGRVPFRGASIMSTLHEVCWTEPESIKTLNPNVPPWLAELIQRLHAKDPHQRPASADEVAAVLRGRAVDSTSPAIVVPATKPATHRNKEATRASFPYQPVVIVSLLTVATFLLAFIASLSFGSDAAVIAMNSAELLELLEGDDTDLRIVLSRDGPYLWLIRIKRIVAQKVEVYWRKLCCTNRLRRAPSVVALASTLSPCL